MKTLYVTGKDMELINVLPSRVRSNYSKDLEVVGEELFNEDVIQNCSFVQPDFLVCDFINKENAKDFFDSCPNGNIILISNDSNRSNSLITELNKMNYYNITSLNKDTVQPNSLCEMLINYNSELDEVAKKEVQQTIIETSKNEELSTPTIDLGKIEEEPKQEHSDVLSMSSLEKMMEEETPENIEKRNEEIQKESEENMKRVQMLGQNEETTSSTAIDYSTINFANIKSKTIAVFSKKGGTGKTTIAKELGNVFSSIQLPKKLANGHKNLRTIVVDMDFECGNLRTFLGIDNPVPNIYMWINDILDKLEDGMPMEKIYFNSMQVMQNYSILMANNFRVLPTDQGDISPRIIQRIVKMDQDGTLLPKIIKKIIKSLKQTFDIVILDCYGNFDDLTQVILESADDIVYPMLPTLADIENFKSFNDDIAENGRISPQKIKVVMNQYNKRIKFTEDFDDVLKLVKYQTIDFDTNKKESVSYTCNLKIPFNLNAINFNNTVTNMFFVTTNGSVAERQPYLRIASEIFPPFKVKNSNEQLEKYKQNLKKKELEKAKKEKTEALKKAQSEKEEQKKLQEEKTKSKKDKKKNKVKPAKSEDKENKSVAKEVNKAEQVNSSETIVATSTSSIKDYLVSDLSKETLEGFIKNLQSFDEIKRMNNNFPIYQGKQPPKLPNKIWKAYQKTFKNEYKLYLKNKKKTKKAKSPSPKKEEVKKQ